jgi:hypothetical protein
MRMIPWTWFGMTTNASRSISGRMDLDLAHSLATMLPASFNCTSPSLISPNRHARRCVQIVTKYAPVAA